MPTQIVLTYAFGIIFFILAIEEDAQVKNLIYAAMSFFINVIAYYLSYTSTDFVALAYLPLSIAAISILLLIYRVYGYLPKDTPFGDSWDEDENGGYNPKKDLG